MCDYQYVQVFPRNLLICEVSEHSCNKTGCSIVHIQTRLAFWKPVMFFGTAAASHSMQPFERCSITVE
jgi:hypothetical protein